MMIQVEVQPEVVTVTVLEDWRAAQRQFRRAMSTSISIAGFSTTERPPDTALTATSANTNLTAAFKPAQLAFFV